jgi:predicted RNase H-like HicB family nuclease
MEKLRIIIEKSSDYYSAYAENCPGIYGAGENVAVTKENIMKGLELFIKITPELPDILKADYEIEYHFDVPSFLTYYSAIFSKSALERITGINQTQLSHYVSGFRKPSKSTVKKLDHAIHQLADELSQVHFV